MDFIFPSMVHTLVALAALVFSLLPARILPAAKEYPFLARARHAMDASSVRVSLKGSAWWHLF